VPPEADHVTPVFGVPVTLTVNCCIPPVVTEAEAGLIETAMVEELEFAAAEPEETPQPIRPKVPASTRTKPATVRKEHRFILRGLVLFEVSNGFRVDIILEYQHATIVVPTQVSKVHADQGRSTMQILQ